MTNLRRTGENFCLCVRVCVCVCGGGGGGRGGGGGQKLAEKLYFLKYANN